MTRKKKVDVAPTHDEVEYNVSLQKHYPMGIVVGLWGMFEDLYTYCSTPEEKKLINKMSGLSDELMTLIKKNRYPNKK